MRMADALGLQVADGYGELGGGFRRFRLGGLQATHEQEQARQELKHAQEVLSAAIPAVSRVVMSPPATIRLHRMLIIVRRIIALQTRRVTVVSTWEASVGY